MSIPIEEFRVTVSGEHFAVFEVLIQPTHWRNSAIGDDSVERQRRFIHDAIAEKIRQEQETSNKKSKQEQSNER